MCQQVHYDAIEIVQKGAQPHLPLKNGKDLQRNNSFTESLAAQPN